MTAGRVFAPGRSDLPDVVDDAASYSPRRGAGGQYARFIKGSTPKYARNNGLREEQMRDTMARMFIRVNASEYELFKNSVGDENTRRLIDRIAGDPTQPRRRGEGYNDTGYMDFLITSATHGFQEKKQVSETLSDNYVVYYFGQSSPVFQYQGVLFNTVQDDQVVNMVRLYTHLLRGTKLAQRQKTVTLRYDSFVVNGTVEDLQWSLQSDNETRVPFSFSFRVKRLYIVQYTHGWIPTRPNGPIADPLAIAHDGRPIASGSVQAMVSQTPLNTEELGPRPDELPDETDDDRAVPEEPEAGTPGGAAGPVNPNVRPAGTTATTPSPVPEPVSSR